jgi:hypothetical protein
MTTDAPATSPPPAELSAAVDAAGARLLAAFGACAAAPDDLASAQETDLALAALDRALATLPTDAMEAHPMTAETSMTAETPMTAETGKTAETRKITVTRMYHDEQGESHFADETVEATAMDFAPPAPPIFVTPPIQAARVVHLFLPAGFQGDFHPAPRRQVMTLLSGLLESGTSDGEVRQFTPGSSTLVEDTEGRGHSTKALEDCVMVVAQLD